MKVAKSGLALATVAGMLGLGSVGIGSAFAQRVANTPFCNNLSEIGAGVQSRIDVGKETLDNRRENFRTNFTVALESAIERYENTRATADTNRQVRYGALRNRVGQDQASLQAVDAFETRVETAVTVRRDAVDASGKEILYTGIGGMTSHKNSVDAAIVSLQSAVDQALTGAEVDCADDSTRVTARLNYSQAISDARSNYWDAVRSANQDLRGVVSEVRATRREEVQAAFAVFKIELEAAIAELRAALK